MSGNTGVEAVREDAALGAAPAPVGNVASGAEFGFLKEEHHR